MIKNIIKFLIILFPWFLSGLLINNYDYYNTLNLPFLALPSSLFKYFWTIIYILIAISIYKIVTQKKYDKNYFKILTINYIFNQLYTFIFFQLKNNFLGFVDVLLTFITGLFLYLETKEKDTSASKWLLPYLYFLLYACYLSISIYFLNF